MDTPMPKVSKKYAILLSLLFSSLFVSLIAQDRHPSYNQPAAADTTPGGDSTGAARLTLPVLPDSLGIDSLGVDSLLTDIDFSISGYNHNSLLSRRNAGEDIVPDGHFAALLDISEKYKEMTDGAFDVYSGPLFDIWGFGFTADSLPSPEKIEQALRDSREGKTLNFNAIAQGYSCDVVARYLYSIGVEDMLVDIGEIYCDGLNPSGEGWRIGIDNPVDGNNSPGKDIRAIWSSEGRACGIVTSGNYRKFYIKDGRKYAHTIDPRTGYPVQHDLLSATIVAPTAAEADALATACMVMGPGKAREFIESRPDIEGYLITSEGVWASSGFRLEE